MDDQKQIPLPEIGLTRRYCKLKYGMGYRHGVYIEFPCIPSIGIMLNDNVYHKVMAFLEVRGDSRVYRKPNFIRIEFPIKEVEISDEILKTFFGKKTLQTFYRIIMKKSRIAIKNTRSMWCIPVGDISKFSHRYRKTAWNESEIVPKIYQWLFEPLHEQLMNFLGSGGRPMDFKPDYSPFDVGEDRKPLLYKCNLCGFEGVKDTFKWGSPIPGVASHQITECLKCGKGVWSDGADPFTSMMTFGVEKTAFAPTSRWQDDWWFNF